MKNRVAIILVTIILLGVSACSTTFRGRVIDADTKEPIEGAVVVASWRGEQAIGTEMPLKDVKEALTDKNGEWKIRGPRGTQGGGCITCFTCLTFTYSTRKPEFIVFKPGYCSYPGGFFIDACKEKMKRGIGDGETTELPRLTNIEDRLSNLPGYKSDSGSGISYKEAVRKQKEFIRLLNEESRNLGASEYKMKGLENEK